MDEDRTQDAHAPTVTLLTGNELLGLFFRHFLGEQAQLNVRLADFRQAPEARADLILVDAGQTQTEELSELIDQLDERAPLALVNIVPQQAEELLDNIPAYAACSTATPPASICSRASACCSPAATGCRAC